MVSKPNPRELVITVDDNLEYHAMNRFQKPRGYEGGYIIALESTNDYGPEGLYYKFNIIDRRKMFVVIAGDLAPGVAVAFDVTDHYTRRWHTVLEWDLVRLEHKADKIRSGGIMDVNLEYGIYKAYIDKNCGVRIEQRLP